jgi:hypothetical protein
MKKEKVGTAINKQSDACRATTIIYFASPSDELILELSQDSQPHAIVDESTCSTISVPLLLQCIYVIALCVLIAFGSCPIPPYLMAALG